MATSRHLAIDAFQLSRNASKARSFCLAFFLLQHHASRLFSPVDRLLWPRGTRKHGWNFFRRFRPLRCFSAMELRSKRRPASPLDTPIRNGQELRIAGVARVPDGLDCAS